MATFGVTREDLLRYKGLITSGTMAAPPSTDYFVVDGDYFKWSSGSWVLVADVQGDVDGAGPLTTTELKNFRSLVSGAGIVATSRSALVTDNGATRELADGVTYTLTDAVALPAGVVWIGPVSGSATIAVTGTATANGGTTSITVAAGQVFSGIPRATDPTAFVVKGS